MERFRYFKILLFILLGVIIVSCKPEIKGTHLFILSGQSNMTNINPNDSFTPILNDEFGERNVIVVQHAKGAQPIRRWYKAWKPFKGDTPKTRPNTYVNMVQIVKDSIINHKISTISFIWMQGEQDAIENLGLVYKKSLIGVYQQLCDDLGRNDINFVIGRLNDFDMGQNHSHWPMIRDAQKEIGESNVRFDWVDTDDLNDNCYKGDKLIENHIHMSPEGFVKLGERFADKAVELIYENHKEN